MNSSTRTRLVLSRVHLRTFLLIAGVLSLLIWSLSGSATSRSGSNNTTGNKTTATSQPDTANVANSSIPTMMAPFKPASADLNQVRNGGVGCDQTVPNS